MGNRLSFLAVLLTGAVLLCTRIGYSELRGWTPMKVTTWDALAYYGYLPSTFIHHDLERMGWIEGIDSTYQVVGTGGLYQMLPVEDPALAAQGHRVDKCLIGVALMELPFFFIGHWIAGASDFLQDGFSPPYQWAIAFAPLFYCIAGLFLLRHVLLRWYTGPVVALVLVLLILATNAIQYISVDGAQTHGFLFALYAALLYSTVRWHERPTLTRSLVIGGTITLAVLTRPTEVIMIFIPLLWNTHSHEATALKWAQVKTHRSHFFWMAALGILLVFPQLLYWKIASGSWLFEIGSKWDFLNPHWRVLIGWEKGWFIYTPITVFFVIGLLFITNKPWRKSVLTFTLLNIWIIIAWHDWRYGGSYSARALVQSYPVLALPFAALVQRVISTRWRWPFLGLCAYLLFVNLWQIRQYNNGVIRYDGMTRAEYIRVYLD